jgi:hypothetical protein
MAKTLVGILAASIAALLLGGCGGPSSSSEKQQSPTSTLSPAQVERCEELDQRIKYGTQILSTAGKNKDFLYDEGTRTGQLVEDAKKERASLGC